MKKFVLWLRYKFGKMDATERFMYELAGNMKPVDVDQEKLAEAKARILHERMTMEGIISADTMRELARKQNREYLGRAYDQE